MAFIHQLNQYPIPPYPDNDKERLDLIFQAYDQETLSMWMTVSEISSNIGWHLDMKELQRLEKLLVASDMVYHKTKGYYQALQLSTFGRKVLQEHSLYSKYLDSKSGLLNPGYPKTLIAIREIMGKQITLKELIVSNLNEEDNFRAMFSEDIIQII